MAIRMMHPHTARLPVIRIIVERFVRFTSTSAGPYQAANTIVALTPSYKESFEVYGLIPTQCGYCSDGASDECRAAPVHGKPRGSAREWVHAVIVIICSLLAKVTEVQGQGEIGHSFDVASNVFNKNARNGQSE